MMRIELNQRDRRSGFSVIAIDENSMVCNTELAPDEALYAVAGMMLTGKSRFLHAPIDGIRQEIRFRGLINSFGGDL